MLLCLVFLFLATISYAEAKISISEVGTAYSLGDKALRTTGVGSESVGGLYFVATTAGTTGGTEPTWNATVDGTTSDGTVTWTTYSIIYYDADPVSAGYSDT